MLTNGVNVGGRAGHTGTRLVRWPAGRTADDGRPLRTGTAPADRQLRHDRGTSVSASRPSAGAKVDLLRIGGEGGLLDNPMLEGGMIGTFDTEFESGEILLPPASRVDVVARFPPMSTGR